MVVAEQLVGHLLLLLQLALLLPPLRILSVTQRLLVLAQSHTRALKLPGGNPASNGCCGCWGGNRTPTILATADAGQIWRGRGPDLDGTVGTLNGLLERTHSMINSSLNAGARSSAESPESKTIRKFGTVTSRLEGLYKVRDMQVDQGVSTAAIDNAIAKLQSELR